MRFIHRQDQRAIQQRQRTFVTIGVLGGVQRLQLDDEKWMLFIPWHFPLQDDSAVTGSSQKAESAFQKQFPRIFEHLVSHKKELSERNQAETGIRYEWYALQRWAADYHTDFLKPKIVYPEITKRLNFFLDTDGAFYTNNKTFILTSDFESLPYLAAALNSTLFRCCFMDNFPNLGEDRRELRKIFMDKIPIRKPTAQQVTLFEALVPMVQAVKAESQKSGNTELQSVGAFLEEVIDACVMEVYFADHMAEQRLGIMAHVTPLLQDFNAAALPSQQVAAARQFYAQANDSKHPIRNILIRIPVDSPDLLAVIQREGAV